MENCTGYVHDVPNSFHMGINPNVEFDMDESFVFQGFPDVFVSTSSPEIDVLLIVDEGIYWRSFRYIY